MATAPKEAGTHRRRTTGGPWRAVRRLSQRTPLRIKLITALLALVAIALSVISLAGISFLRSYLLGQADATLRNGLIQHQAGQYVAGYLNGEGVRNLNGQAVFWLSSDGKLATVAVPAIMAFNQPSGTIPGPSVSSISSWLATNPQTPVTVPAQSGGDRWRVIAFPVQAPVGTSEASGTVIVGTDVSTVYSTISQLTGIDLIVSAAVLFVLLIVGIAVVRANLIPLDEIEETAEDIAEGNLDRRVPERDPRTEVGSLGRSLNIMLDQIQNAFRARQESEAAALQSEERMRRFIADASHELRTPLTAIRGFAEYYRQRGGIGDASQDAGDTPADTGDTSQDAGDALRDEVAASPPPATGAAPPANGADTGPPAGLPAGPLSHADLDRLIERVESEAMRMGVLVDDMLLLARLDQERPLDFKTVDLLAIAADALHDARVIAPQRAIHLTVGTADAPLVTGDEVGLRQV